MLNMQDLDLSGKRVLIRQDLNVPLSNGKVQSDSRILASLPTIKQAIDRHAAVLLMSHLGRPVEGEPDEQYSLAPVADYLTQSLGQTVSLVSNYLQTTPNVQPGQVCLLENVRFNPGEKSDDASLSKQYATLCDVFVMDAFGTAHRAQASTHGVAKYAETACAGPLLSAELNALGRALKQPARPTIAVVGGAKVSTKLTVLETLCEQVDVLVPGGGIANTFIAALGYDVGKSLYEPDLVDVAKTLLDKAEAGGAKIALPVDVAVAKSFDENSVAQSRALSEVEVDELILDVGPETAESYRNLFKTAGTIVWNGPVGVFEFPHFSAGTKALGLAIAESTAFSIAGGGDTLAAVDRFGLEKSLSYISTGGGAFLEFLEGKKLPAVTILEQS
ncbi:MAG: phosphoglycerate kinase [Acidiferrobacterales bacterium]|nr:phosphoglycerate kinase [Acidiferrobacterales bacterium]